MIYKKGVDDLMRSILVTNGMSEMGAYALINEQIMTEASDRHFLYNLVRQHLVPNPRTPGNPRTGR